jgi:dTDP-4-dehydrorhamnose reductase
VKKKLLITGGSGLLAINWAIAFRDKFEITLVLHNRKITLKGVKTKKFTIDTIDKCLLVLEKIKPDIVIHTVGLTNVEECESNPKLAHLVNADIPKNIAIACQSKKIKLVHISTDHLFSGRKKLVKENEAPCPVNVYGKSKLKGEQLVQENCNEPLIIRTNFFGWGAEYHKSFSDFILSSLNNGESINLFNDVFYTPIIIEQLCIKVHELVNLNANGIYHIGGGERLSKFEFGIKLAYGFDLKVDLINSVSIKEKSDLVTRPSDMSLSNEKLDKILNFQTPSIDNQIQILKMQQNLGIESRFKY